MDTYTISSSDSSSFCTNPSVRSHHIGATAAANKDALAMSRAGGDTTRSAIASKRKPDTVSATMRKVNTDYMQQMEELTERTAAMQRYKMLVRGSRLVQDHNESSSKKGTSDGGSPMKTKSQPRRRSSGRRGDSEFCLDNIGEAPLSTEVSDDSDVEQDAGLGAAFPPGSTAPSRPSTGACASAGRTGDSPAAKAPCPPSQEGEDGQTPVRGKGQRHDRRDGREGTPASASEKKSRSRHTRKGVGLDDKSEDANTCSDRCPYPVSYENEEAPVYRDPETTEPIVKPSHPRRDSMRPNFEPVLEGMEQRAREEERVREDGGGAVDAATPVGPSERRKRDPIHMNEEGEERLPMAGGSKGAFWVRPNSALYEMTVSIGAKRKDHPPSKYEEGMGYTRIDSRGSSIPDSQRRDDSKHCTRRPSSRPEFDTRLSRRNSALVEGSDVPFSRHTAGSVALRGGGGALRGTNPNTNTSTSSPSSSRRKQHLSIAGEMPRSPRPTGGAKVASSSSSIVTTPDSSSRVSDRQAQYFAKHCSRLASGRDSVGTGAELQLPAASAMKVSASHRAAALKSGNSSLSNTSIRRADAAKAVKAAAGADSRQPGGSASAAAAARTVATRNSPNPRNPPMKVAKESPMVSKRLQFDFDAQPAHTATSGDDVPPSPVSAVPMATPLSEAIAPTTGRSHSRSSVALSPATRVDDTNTNRTHTSLLHNTPTEYRLTPMKQGLERRVSTLTKSRRREQDRIASESPARDDGPAEAEEAAHRSTLDEAVRLHVSAMDKAREVYEQVRGSAIPSSRNRSGSLPTATQSRTRMATNEVVASMLQGIVQQSWRVLPCYLCAELQNVGTYKLHIGICGAKMRMLLQGRDLSEAAQGELEAMSRTELPTASTLDAEGKAFSRACYVCAKALLMPCAKCGTRIRMYDVKEHELLCGRSYYEHSKAAQRVREVVDRIEHGSSTSSTSTPQPPPNRA